MSQYLHDFDFQLPLSAIAQKPAIPRDSAKLLNASDGQFIDDYINHLPDLLRAGDLMIVNNTKVIPAQLTGYKDTARVRFTLHQRISCDSWRAFAKPAKKCSQGALIQFGDDFHAQIKSRGENGEIILQFPDKDDCLDKKIERYGVMPLPPYIKRPHSGDAADRYDYQTVFARYAGAVAAPTAGLHFTDDLRQRLIKKGIHFAEVTLHVGAGTFLPVKTEKLCDHKMHSEWGEVSQSTVDAINQAKRAGGRIIAVGTTSLRILEAAYQAEGRLAPFSGETDIFITPGYKFGVIDTLLTNFHLPRSTLLMLVSAFSGRDFILSAYQHAIDAGYRFFSYGDACLLTCDNRHDNERP